MSLYHSWKDSPKEHTLLTIGTFDGVHLGHQKILAFMQQEKKRLEQQLAHPLVTGALTFSAHPKTLLSPMKAPPLLTTVEEKCDLLLDQIDFVQLLQFDQSLRQLDARAFIEKLLEHHHVHSFILGEGAMFGKNRDGTQELMEKLGEEKGFSTYYIPKTPHGNQPLSSSLLRKLLAQGALDQVAEGLGRPYSITSTVRYGKALGKEITQVRTANLSVEGLAIPPTGVYCVRATTQDGASHPAIANLGYAPTLQRERTILCEVHLLDGEFDLYSQTMTVVFAKFLRKEQQFDSSEALKKQILSDIKQAKAYWAQRPHVQDI